MLGIKGTLGAMTISNCLAFCTVAYVMSATAGICGIFSFPNAITLGWTSPYDFIFANNYQGDVIVKEGKTFIDEDGNTYESGTVSASAIDGKTLYPSIPGAIFYLDENGQQRLCAEYTTLTSTIIRRRVATWTMPLTKRISD